jgi:hypothetical protein
MKVLKLGYLLQKILWDYNLLYIYKATVEFALLSTCFHAGFLLRLFFGPENGGYMFLRKVGWLSADYLELYPRRQNSLYRNKFKIENRVVLAYIPFLWYKIKRLWSPRSLYIFVSLFKFELLYINTADIETFPLALCLIAIIDEQFQKDIRNLYRNRQ